MNWHSFKGVIVEYARASIPG